MARRMERIYRISPKLHKAMAQLRRDDCVAGHLGDCSSCGWAEADHKAKERAEKGKATSGVVFYHDQGADRVQQDGDSLFLYYGTIEDGTDADTVAVGQKAVKILKANGLKVKWDGSASHAIEVINAAEAKE